MPVGFACKLGAVAAMAFAGLLAGVISICAPASPGAPFDHVVAGIFAAIAATKIAAAAAGLIVYWAEQRRQPAGAA